MTLTRVARSEASRFARTEAVNRPCAPIHDDDQLVYGLPDGRSVGSVFQERFSR